MYLVIVKDPSGETVVVGDAKGQPFAELDQAVARKAELSALYGGATVKKIQGG